MTQIFVLLLLCLGIVGFATLAKEILQETEKSLYSLRMMVGPGRRATGGHDGRGFSRHIEGRGEVQGLVYCEKGFFEGLESFYRENSDRERDEVI